MRQTLFNLIKKLVSFLRHTFRKDNPKLPYILIALAALILVIAGTNIFIELTETLREDELSQYDQLISDFVISFRSPALTEFFIFVTNIGDVYGYLVMFAIAILASILYFKNWKYILQTIFVLLLASISNVLLKRLVDRARPGAEHLVVVETLSYPSGHAMSAMAFYGFLIYLFYRFKINRWIKYVITIFLITVILSIGISRIYLGVHYPSDVAGGFIAGLIWVFFCILLFNLAEVFRRDPKV
ncbi:phosphatase PAP2 family protein [Aequorivita sp. F47161]|uniref:Phosphatase PAP2 family protein n=1 Tax=Aequorivita vitellina TaxID=2874475 RepID=A0A9X1QVT2_9FLAO|nr:phosphatase PAP2 family protein [Aequorivita vitellina]MCG2419650.1 phosphatase PAP2 family protein [Aequorivita vitellina]